MRLWHSKTTCPEALAYAYNSRSMELYVVAALTVIGCVMLALWVVARRIRAWKEQILHAVSIVESNNAIAHEVTRRELLQQLERRHAFTKQLEDGIAAIRIEVEELSEQTNLRRLIRGTVGPPRLIADANPPSVRFGTSCSASRSNARHHTGAG